LAKSKHILIFIDWYLPGYRAGGPIQSVANLVGRLPYHFWIVTSRYDHHCEDPYADVPVGEWVERRPNERIMYLERNGLSTSVLDQILSERDFDRFYINSLFSREFALTPLRYFRKKGLSEKVILAPRGMLKQGALSVKSRKKRLFLFLSQKLGWFDGITWHATNAAEADEIKKHYPKAADIRVAPNLPREPHSRFQRSQKKANQLRLVCVARVSREKNIDGGIDFLSALPGHLDVQWDVYGTMQDAAYLKSCRDAANRIPATVNFKGEIAPKEIPAMLSSYDFFFLPTLGENYGHAIAESLLSGLPVIISDRTPWQQIESNHAGFTLPLEKEKFTTVLRQCAEMDEATYLSYCKGAQELGRQVAEDPAGMHANMKLFS
jgi:glycosyltransferase involved in cell wall biosynthesis